MTEYELDDELNKMIELTGVIRNEQGCNVYTAATRALREADVYWLSAMYAMYDLDLDTLSHYVAQKYLEKQGE